MSLSLDRAWAAVAFAAVLVLLVLVGWARAQIGLSGADDAWFAINAQSLAAGRGYGMPLSLGGFAPFDPQTGTGPAVVLPVAFLIAVFGSLDWLPGAVQLAFFTTQMAVATAILARHVGWAAGGVFMSVALLLLMLVSVNNWYFGMLVGEPVAFGFILIGTLLLAFSSSRATILIAGLCFSLAFMTKQISLFAVAGITASWALATIRERVVAVTVVRRVGALCAAIVSLPLAWEAFKLIQLGPDGYATHLSRSRSIVAELGFGSGEVSDRLTSFLTRLAEVPYVPYVVAFAGIVGLLLLLLMFRGLGSGQGAIRRLMVFAWAGALVHLAYAIIFSIGWARYHWIGAALAVVALVTPLLALGRTARLLTAASLFGGIVAFGFHRPVLDLYGWLQVSRDAAERVAVVDILDQHPSTPYVAEGWSSIYDVVYLDGREGAWAYGPDVDMLAGDEVIALINHAFTPTDGVFFQAVVSTCRSLTDDAVRLDAYLCGDPFWTRYLRGEPSAPALANGPDPAPGVPEDLGTEGIDPAVPPYIIGRPMGTGGGCNMETLNGRPWANEVLEVGSAATIEITGWAFDDERKALARAIHVLLRDASGTDHYATTSRVVRPDVGDYFGDAELAAAGYTASFASASLPSGEYEAMVVMDTESGPVLCAAGRRLRL